MQVETEKYILYIQSHVVHGYVGNKSATFPLQVWLNWIEVKYTYNTNKLDVPWQFPFFDLFSLFMNNFFPT